MCFNMSFWKNLLSSDFGGHFSFLSYMISFTLNITYIISYKVLKNRCSTDDLISELRRFYVIDSIITAQIVFVLFI